MLGRNLARNRWKFKSDPRNQFEMRKAGTQDSGLFFCASYENRIAVFLASPGGLAGFRTR
jgi:hypothetical protein